MAAPVNRPPEVTHHAPTHPGADHHNAVLAAARARVDELEPKLVAVLEPILRRAGDEAAHRFRKYATNHLTAAGPLTADGQPPPPDWTAPAGDELVDTDALAAQLRGKTDPIRLALIQDVLGAVFGEPGVTEEEAIAFYHSPKAFELNEALRSGKPLTVEQQSIVNALDKAMTPSEERMTLYRGIPDARAILGTSSVSKIEGSTFQTAGYLSTSETAETADLFAGGIAGPGDAPLVMQINVPKGTPMLRIPAGDYGDQEEWLLPRELRIGLGTAVREDDPFGGQTIHVTSTATSKGTLSSSTEGVAQGAGIALSFDVDNPLIDGLIAKTGQHIVGIAETTQANVMRAIGSSYKEGLSIPDTAKVITQVMHEAAGPRAIMIARCLPGETLVDGAVVRAVTRRWYEGDMAVVRTEAGREFTATPNHPMFTAQGWRGLGELKEGDDLVCYRRDEDAGTASDEDVDDGPPSLVEIFEAATAVGIVERRTGGEPDFHGDGREGEVDIARPHRELALGYMPVLHQESVEDVLAPSVVTDGALFCSGCGHLLAVEKERCLCGVPSPGPALADDANDQTTGDVECSGEGVDALTRMETREYLPLREVVSSRGRLAPVREVVGAGLTEVAAGNALYSEPFEDGALVHPGTLRDSGRAQAGEIELDRVVSVHRAPFIGFVYNLCTPYGYFTVNGGYTGNTEMTSAVNGASLAAAQVIGQATGKTMTKTWLTAPGARYPRHEDYEDLDGQTVKQDETFTVGDSELQYPGDPDGDAGEVVNCRCSMVFSDGSEVEAE